MTANPAATAGVPERRESTTHWMAHQAVVFVRPVFLIFLGATVVLMATFWPLAVVTGFIAMVCGVIVWIGRGVEDRSESGEAEGSQASRTAAEGAARLDLRSTTEPGEQVELETTHVPGGEVDARTLIHESWMVGGIAVGLVLLAIILGLALFDWHMLLLGIGIVLLYAAFITFPAWSAWLADDAERREKQMKRQGG